MSRVAIVGAGGLVGSELIRSLLPEKRWTPVAICRNNFSADRTRRAGCETRIADLQIGDEAEKALYDCEALINCAFPSGSPKRSLNLQLKLLNGIFGQGGIQKVIHLSSVAVYGSHIGSEANFARPDSNDVYGMLKLETERIALRLRKKGQKVHVVRLGHVIGAGSGMSRAVIDLAANRSFSLPFNGALPSNTIRIDQACAGLMHLLESNEAFETVNLVSNPNSTWREVFDWHTDLLGIEKVDAMNETASRILHELHRTRYGSKPLPRLIRESGNWLKSMPSSFVSSCPSLKEFISQICLQLPIQVENYFRDKHAMRQARTSTQAKVLPDAPPWLTGGVIPGPCLRGPSPEPDDEIVTASMRNWLSEMEIPKWPIFENSPASTP